MRRKFISALLFGALVTASTSTFVSCKDYDDDINGLQGQITTNASTLEEMVNEKVSNLTTEINTLKDQDAALTQALDQAKADLNAAIEEAKTAASDAEAAAKAYADVQAEAARVAAIEAAKQSIADAQAQLQAGIDAATQKLEEISGQVSTHETQIAGLLDADKKLQDAITAANGKIDAAQTTANDALASAQEANDKLAQVVENLTTVKGELDSQISLLGDKVDQAVADIAANKAEVDADIAEANSLIQSNADAIAALQGKDTELGKLIEANTNELTALKGQLESLQSALDANLESAKAYTDAQIEGLKSALGIPVEDIKTNFEDIQGRLGKAEEQLAEIVEALKSDDGSIGSISSSIASLREGLTELTEQVATNLETTNQKIGELEGDIEEINGKLATNTTNISDLQERVSTLESQIGQWAEGIGTVAENVKLMQDNIKAHSDELARLAGVSKLLKGLVFNPEKYYQGIEAIGIESFNYHAIIAGLQTPNLDDDQTDDKATRLASTETSVVPIVEASYWMNPSNATVDTVTANVKKHFSFIVNNAEYTRAAQEYNRREQASLDTVAVYTPYGLESDVPQLRQQPVRWKGNTVNVAPSNEVVTWPAGASLTVTMEKARTLAGLSFNLGTKQISASFKLEASADGGDWQPIELVQRADRDVINTTNAINGMKADRIRLTNVSGKELKVYFRNFQFTVAH